MSTVKAIPTVGVCATCPWRKSNHGKPHPAGWYRKANIKRLTGGLAWLAGAARIARVSQALAGGRRVRMRRAGVRTTATRSTVEHEVFQALIGLKCSPFAASRAVVTARAFAPQEFEPLFRAALSELDPKTQAKARFQETPTSRTM